MTRNLVCIRCPLGCPLKVELEGSEVVSVTGQSCPRGTDYAKVECVAPTRTITSTVRISGGDIAMLPVRTATDIPKSKIMACMQAIHGLRVDAPIAIGDVILDNIAGTGVNLVATRNIAKI